MSIVKVVEIMGESPKGWPEAVETTIERASKTLKNIRSAYIKEHSVTVSDGKIDSYRVNLKVTFEVE